MPTDPYEVLGVTKDTSGDVPHLGKILDIIMLAIPGSRSEFAVSVVEAVPS